jgi:hypothetical protein
MIFHTRVQDLLGLGSRV